MTTSVNSCNANAAELTVRRVAINYKCVCLMLGGEEARRLVWAPSRLRWGAGWAVAQVVPACSALAGWAWSVDGV